MPLDQISSLLKMNRRVLIRDVNPSLVCVLCKGYYIDATTIVECVHSFCRSCIVKHFESSKYCPICEVMVHKTKPLLSLKRDKTLQDIVYKLVPGLFAKEMSQRRLFYMERPHYVKPEDIESGGDAADIRKTYISDDSITISLKYVRSDCAPCYLRCPVGVSINHLQKIITGKYGLDANKVRVEILLNDQMLDGDLTLLDIACLFHCNSKEVQEFSYVIMEMKTCADDCKARLGHEIKVAKDDSVVIDSDIVEKEVQLQITETGIMSMSAIDELLQEGTQIVQPIASTSSITTTAQAPAVDSSSNHSPLTTVTALPPSVSSLAPPRVIDRKRLSGEDGKYESNKLKRLSIDCSSKKSKRPSTDDAVQSKQVDVKIPKRSDSLKDEKKSTVSKSDATESQDKIDGKYLNIEKETCRSGGDHGNIETKSLKEDKPIDGCILKSAALPTPTANSSSHEEHKKSTPTDSSNTNNRNPVNTAIFKTTPDNETRKAVKSINTVPSTSNKNADNLPTEVKTVPQPQGSPSATNSKESIGSSTNKTKSPVKSPAAETSIPDKSKHKSVTRTQPELWRPVITKEKLRPTLMNNSDDSKKPGKFFRREEKFQRNMPRFLGNPASGVKAMYSNGMESKSSSKSPEKKPEPIIRMDPKTLRPFKKEEKKSPNMIMTNPFIPRDMKVVLPDPKTQPYNHMPAGFHASLPPSISLLMNPHQHFRNLKRKEAAEAANSRCDTRESKTSASGSNPATDPDTPRLNCS